MLQSYLKARLCLHDDEQCSVAVSSRGGSLPCNGREALIAIATIAFMYQQLVLVAVVHNLWLFGFLYIVLKEKRKKQNKTKQAFMFRCKDSCGKDTL